MINDNTLAGGKEEVLRGGGEGGRVEGWCDRGDPQPF